MTGEMFGQLEIEEKEFRSVVDWIQEVKDGLPLEVKVGLSKLIHNETIRRMNGGQDEHDD